MNYIDDYKNKNGILKDVNEKTAHTFVHSAKDGLVEGGMPNAITLPTLTKARYTIGLITW